MGVVYSISDSEWKESLDEVLDEYLSEYDEHEGSGTKVIMVDKGIARDPCVTSFIPDIAYRIQETVGAYDSDCCQYPYNFTTHQVRQLQDEVNRVVKAYCKKVGVGAGFFYVDDTTEVEVSFTYQDGELLDYEEKEHED